MAKINAHGTILNLGDALVSPTFTAIAQVETFDGPEVTRGGIEVPAHDDTGIVEVVAEALYRMGEISGTILYDPNDATHDGTTGLVSIAENGEERPFQFVFPVSPAAQWDFNGFLARFSPTGFDANSGMMRADFAVRPTGSVTLA